MATLRIHPATREQAAAIAALLREAFHPEIEILGLNSQDHPYHGAFETAANVRRRLQQGTVAVGYEGDRLAGTVSYEVSPAWATEVLDETADFGWIERLAVHPDFRGQGYGEELMAYAEEQLRAQGVARIWLAIIQRFDRLEAFYERLGYRPAKTITHPPYPYEILFMVKD